MDVVILTFICLFLAFLLFFTGVAIKGMFDILVRGKPVIRLDKEAMNSPEVQELIALGQQVYGKKLARDLEDRRLGLTEDDIDALLDKKKAPQPDLEDAPGIRDLLDEGRDDEAVETYRKFAGVDEYTARAAVDQIKQAMKGEGDG